MRIGSIGGTQIHIEGSFFIIVGLFVVLNLESGQPLHHALLWIPLLVVSVLIHELGHAATLAMLGFGPSHVALAGFGGITINRRDALPWQNILVSIAGPLCSFLLAGLAAFLLVFVSYFESDPFFQAFLPLVVVANLFWGVFNLLPILPMDGGHVLSNLARYFFTPKTADLVSSWISVVFSIGILGLALFARQVFIAIFAAMFAWQNYQRAQIIRGFEKPEPDDGEERDPDQKE